VGSWHPNDYALQLYEDARVLQRIDALDADEVSCLSFSLVSKVPRETVVFLELDFMNDGIVDFSQRLPVSDWEPRTFRIAAPLQYQGVTFIVRREPGGPPATVAELVVEDGGVCRGTPVELAALPDVSVDTSHSM
jgi:hypothetical protein